MSTEIAFRSGGAAKPPLHRFRPDLFAVTPFVIFSAYNLREDGGKDEFDVEMWMQGDFIWPKS